MRLRAILQVCAYSVALAGVCTAESYAQTNEPLSPQPESLPSPQQATRASRVVLGVRITPVTESAAQQFQLSVRHGALITAIEPGTPADQAGLPLGGVIVAIDGVRIDSPNQLIRIIRIVDPGQTIELSYYEGQRLFRKSIVMNPSVVVDQETPFRERTPGTAVPNDIPLSIPQDSPIIALEANPRFGPRVRRLRPNSGRILRSPEQIGPLLGDISRIIDGFISPAPNGLTIPRDYQQQLSPPNHEIEALRDRVRDLQSQLEQMQRKVEILERQLVEAR